MAAEGGAAGLLFNLELSIRKRRDRLQKIRAQFSAADARKRAPGLGRSLFVSDSCPRAHALGYGLTPRWGSITRSWIASSSLNPCELSRSGTAQIFTIIIVTRSSSVLRFRPEPSGAERPPHFGPGPGTSTRARRRTGPPEPGKGAGLVQQRLLTPGRWPPSSKRGCRSGPGASGSSGMAARCTAGTRSGN